MGKKLVRMEVVMDVSRPERTDEVIQRSLYGQNMLSSCMRPLIEAESVVEASRELLSEICRFTVRRKALCCFFPERKSGCLESAAGGIPGSGKEAHFGENHCLLGKILSNEKQVVIKMWSSLPGRMRDFI